MAKMEAVAQLIHNTIQDMKMIFDPEKVDQPGVEVWVVSADPATIARLKVLDEPGKRRRSRPARARTKRGRRAARGPIA